MGHNGLFTQNSTQAPYVNFNVCGTRQRTDGFLRVGIKNGQDNLKAVFIFDCDLLGQKDFHFGVGAAATGDFKVDKFTVAL